MTSFSFSFSRYSSSVIVYKKPFFKKESFTKEKIYLKINIKKGDFI